MISNFRKEELISLAEFVAELYCPRGLIDPQIIAEENEITYSYGSYENAFDGLLEHSYGQFHIYLNMDRLQHSHTERARFTFAHELGHYYIDSHRNALKNGVAPSHPSFTDFSSKNEVEIEADFFAANLLIPPTRLRKDCSMRNFNFTLLEELAKRYQTSITATAIQFASVGTHPILVICARNNKISWVKSSNDFPFKYIKGDGGNVPPNTAMGEYFLLTRKYPQAEVVFAEDWFSGLSKYNLERQFYEKCIYSDNFNFVLSILWER